MFASFSDRVPHWARSDPNNPWSAPHPDLYCWWRAFVFGIIQHVNAETAGYVQHWGVWNEPNNPYGNITPDDAGLITVYAADAIHGLGKTVVATLLGNAAGDREYLEEVLTHDGHVVDVVAFHAYSNPAAIVEHIQYVASLPGAAGKPLWVTEVGWSHGIYAWHDPAEADQGHADVMAHLGEVVALGTIPALDRVFAYALVNDDAGYALVADFPFSPLRRHAFFCTRYATYSPITGLPPSSYGCYPS